MNVGKLSKLTHFSSHNFTCSATWHVPPPAFVPNSVVIVRDPLKRVKSEFCYALKFSGAFWGRSFSPDCDGFFTWSNAVWSKIGSGVATPTSLHNCHLISQWKYAKHAQYVLSFDSVFALPTRPGWRFLQNHFRVNASLLLINESSGDCKAQMAECTVLDAAWKRYYNLDYKYIGACLGPNSSIPCSLSSL